MPKKSSDDMMDIDEDEPLGPAIKRIRESRVELNNNERNLPLGEIMKRRKSRSRSRGKSAAKMSDSGDIELDLDIPLRQSAKKRSSRSRSKKGKKKSSSKRRTAIVKRQRADRHFRIVSVNGQSWQPHGYYKGLNPSQAASKVATRELRETGEKICTVRIQEVTKGSKAKCYCYIVERLRQTTKMPGVRGLKFKYKNRVRAGNKLSNLKKSYK